MMETCDLYIVSKVDPNNDFCLLITLNPEVEDDTDCQYEILSSQNTEFKV